MPRYRRPGVKRTSTGSCGVRGYTLQGRNGRVNYVGVTNAENLEKLGFGGPAAGV